GRTFDLYPDDPKFYENLRRNLIRKFVALNGELPSNCELEVKPLRVKPKRIRVKNTYHRCVEMVFLAKGSKELLELGYKAGFGERNSMGFGMVKVV
ncbi:CRISPR-associated endoribonuclease Cas6, partial [Archaeoglobus sp.]